MENTEKVCVFCKRDQEEVPLVHVEFQNKSYYICPQHMPVIIHNPKELIGLLPGAENLKEG